MDISELQFHLRRLATLEESEAPLISCYLDIELGPASYKAAFEQRIQISRKTLDARALAAFDEAAARVEQFLSTALQPRTKGVAVFARGGERPFFLALQFEVALPTWIAIGPTPNLYHLVELKDNYDRYVILLASEAGAKIIGINLGGVAEQIWNSRPELRKRVGREWSKDHFQDHRRAMNRQFIQEQVRVLERLLANRGYSRLILAGNPRMTAEVMKVLPKSLAGKLVDIVPASAGDRLSDVVACTLRAFLEYEERESQAIAERLAEQIRRHGLAVAGAEATLKALRTGQSDSLVMVKSYDPGQGLRCRECGYVRLTGAAGICPACCRALLRSFDIRSEMVRLAEISDSHIEVVDHSDVLSALGGVGCLLRYPAPEMFATRAA